MQITLCEDDSLFHGGVPSLVILQVKFDDGKVKRIPYPAEKTISSLYQDLNDIAPKVAAAPQTELSSAEIVVEQAEAFKQAIPLIHEKVNKSLEPLKKVLEDKSHVIEKEDIVQMVRIDPGRDKEASFLLVVGMELRVISVISTNVVLAGHEEITRIAQGYDVVDDKAARPERTRVYPHEVELLRKRTAPIIPKISKTEEILPCPGCSAPNALVLEGSDFKGTCSVCGVDICISRVIVKCGTDKCKKEGLSVSCFDVGGKFEGRCNGCGSAIEVPYAS